MSHWEPHLHWSFQGEHVLFPILRLHSWPTFIASCIITVAVCCTERCLSISLNRHLAPSYVKSSPWRYVSWRTAIYGLAVCMRLFYMLIAMTFNVGLILVIAASLASAQLVLVELQELKSTDASSYSPVGSNPRPLRPRPDSIYIHSPGTSDARTNIMALELGTDHVYKAGDGWEPVRGNDAARVASHSELFRLSNEDEGEEAYLSGR